MGSTHQHCPPCWHCLEVKDPLVSQDGMKTLDASIAARRSSSQGDGPDKETRESSRFCSNRAKLFHMVPTL